MTESNGADSQIVFQLLVFLFSFYTPKTWRCFATNSAIACFANFRKLSNSSSEKGSGAGSMAEMAKGEGAKQMLGGFSVLRLASMIGGFMNIEITKEQLLDLNKKLNKIKKKNK